MKFSENHAPIVINFNKKFEKKPKVNLHFFNYRNKEIEVQNLHIFIERDRFTILDYEYSTEKKTTIPKHFTWDVAKRKHNNEHITQGNKIEFKGTIVTNVPIHLARKNKEKYDIEDSVYCDLSIGDVLTIPDDAGIKMDGITLKPISNIKFRVASLKTNFVIKVESKNPQSQITESDIDDDGVIDLTNLDFEIL